MLAAATEEKRELCSSVDTDTDIKLDSKKYEDSLKPKLASHWIPALFEAIITNPKCLNEIQLQRRNELKFKV